MTYWLQPYYTFIIFTAPIWMAMLHASITQFATFLHLSQTTIEKINHTGWIFIVLYMPNLTAGKIFASEMLGNLMFLSPFIFYFFIGIFLSALQRKNPFLKNILISIIGFITSYFAILILMSGLKWIISA